MHWILRESWIAALELAIVAALAVSLAYWTWQALAPRAVAAPTPSVGAGPGRAMPLAARGLLGATQARSSAPGQGSSAGALTLVGVFAARTPGLGRALIARGGGRPELVMAGDELAPGVVLSEVHADHVLVRRGAAAERIELERRGTDATPPPARTPANAPPRRGN